MLDADELAELERPRREIAELRLNRVFLKGTAAFVVSEIEPVEAYRVIEAEEAIYTVKWMCGELLIGLTTTVGGQRLAQLVGPARTLEMMLEGRTYTPAEAMQMGLVNRVVPTESLVEEAKALAARYARRNRGTIAAQKRIFIENLVMSPAECLRNEGTPAQRPSSPARL